MANDNKRNLQYFEAPSMKELYSTIDNWQAKHRKRFASLHVERDGSNFCCIAMTNPTEVMIVNGYFADGVKGAEVKNNCLRVSAKLL